MGRIRLNNYLKYIIIISLFSSCANNSNDIIFEDFESHSFNTWKIQGTAFDKPYLADTITNSKLKNTVKGSGFAYSYINDSVLNQGKLISPVFRIQHKYIDFLIGGGQHVTRTCINLLIDNKIVRSSTGKGQPFLQEESWDVSEFIGQNAIMEIVDARHYSSDDLDYIMVDNIVFSNHLPRPTIIFEDFETGTFNNWQVEGNAFEEPGNRKNIYYPVTVNGFQGKHFAFSFGEKHDKEKGRLTSEKFIITRNYISFLIGGGNHPDSTCINLIVNDSVHFSSTGLSTGELRKEFWNVSHLQGNKAHIEIVDNYALNWGHIIIDNICFTDDVNKKNESVYYHQQIVQPIYKVAIISLVILIILLIIIIWIKRRKENNSIMSKKSFQSTLLNLLENDKIYLNSDLSASKLAETISIPTSELLELSEQVFNKNFNQLINEYRVNYFKEEVLKPENKELKLVAIAKKCGFNSKSSFYRIFKKHTNQTPTEYMQDKS
ncbi:helix-turn-helix transcriptional regulator [Tamlana fucoidanivorans]|uniref:Helix-turn-helix transcriptional regulator n=1 Tax=Allotamlana fucoidanivorans TaxID=2583814 RepID=A0A5C4SD42_9FLAO|nr:helix-turn-helix transcriptional regulator [Tamlana fucoidanivorans]TNJ41251.1 helix-turn-helix transcriptional regulator [Tamlana fucoidanivorans]